MSKPNFQRLLDVVRASEELPLGRFDMSVVHGDEFRSGKHCGTVGCLIGQYNALAGRERSRFADNKGASDWDTFGITEDEYRWLFDAGVLLNRRYTLQTVWCRCYSNLRLVTREQALARLRKFIYYKLHKAEMTEEDARHKEGDHHFVQQAVASAEQPLACV